MKAFFKKSRYNIKLQKNIPIMLCSIFLLNSACVEKTKTPETITDLKLDFKKISGKFKYPHLDKFEMDTLNWDSRALFYTKVNSNEFYQICQDTAVDFLGGHPQSVDLDFFYSRQKSPRDLIEFTILTQREGVYCDRIFYFIYDKNSKLISNFRVAGHCGDGGYYETESGEFINDSTYVLTSENNYDTEDIESENIVTTSKIITTILKDGSLISREMILSKGTKSSL